MLKYKNDLERTNYSLILLALTIFILILYITNPRGYITEFTWFGIIIVIALYIIGFSYLNAIFRTKDPNSSQNNNSNPNSKAGMNIFSWISLILLIIAFSLLSPEIFNDNFLNKKDEYVPYIY
jgi:arginine exporter protein ArgO